MVCRYLGGAGDLHTLHNPSDRRGRRGKIVTTAGHGILYGKEDDPAPAICHNKDESSGTVLAKISLEARKSPNCVIPVR